MAKFMPVIYISTRETLVCIICQYLTRKYASLWLVWTFYVLRYKKCRLNRFQISQLLHFSSQNISSMKYVSCVEEIRWHVFFLFEHESFPMKLRCIFFQKSITFFFERWYFLIYLRYSNFLFRFWWILLSSFAVHRQNPQCMSPREFFCKILNFSCLFVIIVYEKNLGAEQQSHGVYCEGI